MQKYLFRSLTALLLLAAPLCSSSTVLIDPEFAKGPFPVAGSLAGVRIEQVASDLGSVTGITHVGDGRLFVTIRDGRILVLENGTVRSTFLDIRGLVTTVGEGGLLSTAFHPKYGQNGLFFVNYTNNSGDTVIARYQVSGNDPNRADPASARMLLLIDQPFSNHNGGQLQFGPDGKLYAGTGDGGSAGDPRENAQNKGTLLGKLLRINPHKHGSRPYKSPRSNPYVGKKGENEIFARGLRNPFRLAFDRGRIAIGDVGQQRWEEVDYETRRSLRGANFGWDRYEGNHRFDYAGDNEAARARGYQKPIFEYEHVARNRPGACAISGGLVVWNRKLRSLRSRYLYADFYAGELRSFVARRRHGRRDRALGVHVDQPSSFGRGPGGQIYVTSLNGPLYQLVRK